MGYGSNGRGTNGRSGSKQAGRANAWGAKARTEHDAGSLEECPGVLAAIRLVTDAGDAITFSRTTDGGAWSITVLHDRMPTRRYPSGQPELDQAIGELCELYEDAPAAP